MKKRKVKERKFACDKCGNKVIAYKKSCHMTKEGHTKHMWCFKCMEITAHSQLTKWE